MDSQSSMLYGGFHPACAIAGHVRQESERLRGKDFQRMMQPLHDTPMQGLPYVLSLSWGGVLQLFSLHVWLPV